MTKTRWIGDRRRMAVPPQSEAGTVSDVGGCEDRATAPIGHPNVLVVLACVRLWRFTPPQPRSSRALAADTRAAAGAASWLKSPASTLMHSSVCPAPASANRLEFSFGANTYGVGLPPPVGAGIEPASASGVNYDHANNLTQNARTLPTENARPVAMLQIATPVCRARRGPRRRAT
jgi:hypothetical protein